MNLINDRWLPVIRAQGYERIAPREIADTANPVLRLAATRPDFNASLMQFLIGLVQTAFPPTGQQDWIARYLAPPTPDQLGMALAPFAPYFALDGDGIRFMQDFAQQELAEQEPNDIGALLIDSPGQKTETLNKDHFVKRGRIDAACVPCAAAALFTLQTNAPSGGAGHNTSLRGGGPMTTFVAATTHGDMDATLWRAVWLNVLERDQIGRNHPSVDVKEATAIFPWTRPTRTSTDSNSAARKIAGKLGDDAPDKNRPQITSIDGHPLWVYWATPRRIVLDFETVYVGVCDLCGESSSAVVSKYRTETYGANYTTGWRHPLSPYRRKDEDDLDFHPQHFGGSTTYRDWLGLALSTTQTQQRAIAVSEFAERRRAALARHLGNPRRLPFRLHVCGYQMENNMKAVRWHESLMPLPSVDSYRIEEPVQRWIGAAQSASEYLRRALKSAWFSSGATVRGKFDFVTDAYWQSTEDEFYALLDVLSEASTEARASDESLLSMHLRWHGVLRDKALHLFEQHAESGPAEQGNTKRVALARHQLVLNLGGRKLKEALGIPVDAPASAANKSRSRGAGDAASVPAPATT
ncbi:MAG: type I-E CRISPR-associated protein Cse1/CasA [Panacagrimonas sp.]